MFSWRRNATPHKMTMQLERVMGSLRHSPKQGAVLNASKILEPFARLFFAGERGRYGELIDKLKRTCFESFSLERSDFRYE